MTTDPKKSQFLLLLRQPPGGTPPPEELQKIMVLFGAWMKGMSAKGMVLATNGLETTGKVLRGPRGQSVTDGPFVESKEIVGGYMIVNADSLDHAATLAKDCPGLGSGGIVEVRPIDAIPGM